MTTPGPPSRAGTGIDSLAWAALAVALGGLLLVPLAQAWLRAPDLGHGWAAPLLAGYLWWERWPTRPQARALPGTSLLLWVAAIALLLAAIPLRLVLTPYPLWPAALGLYVVLLVSVALLLAWQLAGWPGVRWVGGPLVLLIGILPWAGALERTLILPLREGIASLVAEISNLFGRPALAGGTSVRLTSGWVGVDEACGGIRSLQASVTAALFFGEWLRLGWLRRLGLVFAGALVAISGNFLRVLFLSWRAGESPEALRSLHDVAGWTALGATLVVTGGLGWLWRAKGFSPFALVTPAPRISEPTTAAFRPALRWAFVVVGGLALLEGGTRLWFARGEAARLATVPQWQARLPENDPSFRAQPLMPEARDILRPDGFVAGQWSRPDRRERAAYYIEWHQGQAARSLPFLHNPTVCLPMSGCELVRPLGTIAARWAGGEVPFHAYLFRQMNQDLAVAFTIWDPVRGQPLEKMGDGWAAWWRVQWSDVRAARQHQPGQLLTVAVYGDDGLELLTKEIENLLQPVSSPVLR